MRFPLVAAVLLFIGSFLLILSDGRSDRQVDPKPPDPSAPSVGSHLPEPPVGSSAETSPRVAESDPEGVPEEASAATGAGPEQDFRGSVRIAGSVVGKGGVAVSDARILVRPLGFYPHRREHFEALGTRADDVGRFVLSSAPAATHYEVYAVSRDGGVGKSYVPKEEATKGALTLVVAPVVYERYLLFDPEGKGIPVRDYGIGAALGADDLRDSIRPPDPLLDELLRDIGWSEAQRTANEMFTIYFDDGSRWESMNLRIPGYHDKEVQVAKQSLADWPAATKVVLERNPEDSRILHRIAFPELAERRSESVLPDLVLAVRVDGAGSTTIVGRRCPCVWAPKGSRFEIRQTGFDPLAYTTRQEGDAVLIEPEYPEFGYLVLERELGDAADEGHRSRFFTLMGHFPSPRGRPINGRQAVIGPLPTGTYTVLASSIRNGKTVQNRIGPVTVAGGRNAHTWR